MTEHRAVPYLEQECEPTGEIITERPDRSSDAIRVVADCPACHGASRRTYRRGRSMGNRSSWRDGPAAAVLPTRTVTVICACGFPHPHRPPDVTEPGCGAFWRITLS